MKYKAQGTTQEASKAQGKSSTSILPTKYFKCFKAFLNLHMMTALLGT